MANTLLEAIKANQGKQVTPAPAPTGAQVSSILQTKATGKAAAPNVAAPAASNVQEQGAQQATAVAARAGAQQANQAFAGLGMQEANQAESLRLAESQQDEEAEDSRSRLLQQTSNLLNEYSQGSRTLDANKDKARLEQIGFGLRLTNDEYLSNLQREGKKSRLQSDVQFQEELTRSIFDDEEELLRGDLDFRGLMRADDREFRKIISEMDINYALKIAAADAKAANTASQYGALGSLASAGIQAGEDYAEGKFDKGWSKDGGNAQTKPNS